MRAALVPLDYSRPHGAKITVGFNRLRAHDRAHRVGSLIVNPGGPGGAGSAVVAVEAAGKHLWHPALHERFDLIGMDSRGIGMSTRIKCDPAVFNQPVSLFPRTEAEFDRVTAWAGAWAGVVSGAPGGCSATSTPAASHATWNGCDARSMMGS